MSKPIAATPKLNVKESERFLDMVEEGLKHPCGPVPTPKLPKALRGMGGMRTDPMPRRVRELEKRVKALEDMLVKQ